MRKIIIKQGPVVFLKNVLLMEIVAILVFFGLSFIENYEMLYKNMSLETYLRYDLFILIASASFQFIYIILLFINWYFSYFEINENEVVRKTGLFFNTKKSFSIHNVISIETHQSLLDRAIGHSDIILEYPKEVKLKMRNIPNFEESLHILKQFIKNASQNKKFDSEYIISQGENAEVEFKESFRFDKIKNSVNKDLERVVMKTIVGFLNTSGGSLLIGVNDDGEIIGLQNDFNTLPKKNRDGFENHFNLIFKNFIGVSFVKYVDINFENIKNKDICIISVKSSHKPAYLLGVDKKEEFFIRIGNSTQSLSMSETEEYIKNHFK